MCLVVNSLGWRVWGNPPIQEQEELMYVSQASKKSGACYFWGREAALDGSYSILKASIGSVLAALRAGTTAAAKAAAARATVVIDNTMGS